jgi:RNA polymerase sigma factor for flagellar operon FliA
MLDRLNAEATFLQHVDWIEKVAAIACRKQGLGEAEAEDFAGWVKIRLMEDDYAVLRKFRGESEMRTFLAIVVRRQLSAYSRELRGRWRPSAAAERLGPPAPELEQLVYRDHYPLLQAGEKLRTEGRTTLTNVELARLLAQLPERQPLRPVEVPSDTLLDGAEGTFRADEHVAHAEAAAQRGELMAGLGRAMERMTPEERMIVRMHFGEGRTLADVARVLDLEQKPLYRRIKQLQVRLREHLEREGIEWPTVRAVLEQED